jgi:hypothetical protein
VLARARAIYLGDEEDRWDDIRGDVRRYVDYVVGEIKRLTDGRDNEESQPDALDDSAP